MPEHPCAGGLSAACFKAYPVWARQALAYKLLHILLPKQLSKRLPRGLNLPMVGPGSILPPGVELPPGSIVAPGVTIPQGWTPGDPAPPGVQLPPSVSPVPLDSGAAPPLYTQPFDPGPVHRPSPGPGINEYTVSIMATNTAWAENADIDWDTCQNYESALTKVCEAVSQETSVLASYNSGIYSIRRMYNEFSLTEIPSNATIISATLCLKPTSGSGFSARAYANTYDFNCPSPDFFDVSNTPSDPLIIWPGENIFTLSSDAVVVIQAKIGSTCCINTRENAHDYGNVPPLDTEIYEISFYNCFAESVARPVLNITYEA